MPHTVPPGGVVKRPMLHIRNRHLRKSGAANQSGLSDFTGWNVDALLEKKLAGGGVVDLEGAYYDYDLDDVAADDEPEAALAGEVGAHPLELGVGRQADGERAERVLRVEGRGAGAAHRHEAQRTHQGDRQTAGRRGTDGLADINVMPDQPGHRQGTAADTQQR